MKSDTEKSNTPSLLESLAKTWIPAVMAFQLKENTAACSVEDSRAAAERAGCEVCYADLPSKVSGFAQVIAGKPYIVLNRQKSPQNLKYTLPHELGHHVLHLNAVRGRDELGFPAKDREELEADLFAAAWVLRTTNHKEREQVLQHNSEAVFVLMAWIMASLVGIAIALIVHAGQKLLGAQFLDSEARK